LKRRILAELDLLPLWRARAAPSAVGSARAGDALPAVTTGGAAEEPAADGAVPGGPAPAGRTPRRLAARELMPQRTAWDEDALPGAADDEPAQGVAPMPLEQSSATSPGLTGAASPLADERVRAIATMDWDELERATAACTRCKLGKGRQQAVLGVGDRKATWLLVGEGPGAEEDARGEPFVGQAGKLLDSMLRSVGLERGNGVYIANVVKCRPPQNRTPEPDEAQTCMPFLQRQIELIAPRIIVALGRTAVLGLLGRDSAMPALRGREHSFRGIPVVVTYHPAYYLRRPEEKAKAWQDLCFAQDLFGRL